MKATQLLVCCALTLVTGCGGGDNSNPTDPGPGGGGTNHAPTVNLNIDNTHLAYGGTAQLTAAASDGDGDQVTFTWSGVLGTVSASGPTSTAATFTAGSQWGQASVTVTASDGKGGSAQATALTYIRNPNPPSLALFPAASSTCGTGTGNPYGFILRITPAEAVNFTQIGIATRDEEDCGDVRNYVSSPIILDAGQQYLWQDRGCINPCPTASQPYWSVGIYGRRPEPDGGTFYFECHSWSPSNPSGPCN